MKPFITLPTVLLLCLSFNLSAQPDFNGADIDIMNKEVDSLAAIYWPDENRIKIIALEKEKGRSGVVEFFSTLTPAQQADVIKNRMHQALTVPSLSMLQKRVIVWVMKQVKPGLYEPNNPKREEEAKKMEQELMPTLSKHFTKEQVCLLFTECSMKGIE
jgi:hypothetical protein